MAERIEAVEALGWQMDRFTAVPYKDNITVVALFRRPIQPLADAMAADADIG
jgi:hypothetical protein